MPILPTPDYCPPLLWQSGNGATLYPPLFRPVPCTGTTPEVHRIDTPDGDFLDLDLHRTPDGNHRTLAILSHGLEGNSRKKYMLGMAKAMLGLGLDVVCWNQRGCSGEPNRLPRSYHSGETNDIHAVVSHCIAAHGYEQVVLIGFSMGGNQILKYLGENPDRVPSQVMGAATVSVPCDLDACEVILAWPTMRIYFEYFMRGLRQKVREKAMEFPGEVDAAILDGIRTLRDFDDRFTAPVNGFASGTDYYIRSSSKQFLTEIRVPTLLINAKNDPFLPSRCYPVAEARDNPNLWLETPRYGGHVGFGLPGRDNIYWSEQRVGEFIRSLIP